MEDGVTVNFPILRYVHIYCYFIFTKRSKCSSSAALLGEQKNRSVITFDVAFQSVSGQDKWEQGRKTGRRWVSRKWTRSAGKIASYVGELRTEGNLKIMWFYVQQYLLNLSAAW